MKPQKIARSMSSQGWPRGWSSSRPPAKPRSPRRESCRRAHGPRSTWCGVLVPERGGAGGAHGRQGGAARGRCRTGRGPVRTERSPLPSTRSSCKKELFGRLGVVIHDGDSIVKSSGRARAARKGAPSGRRSKIAVHKAVASVFVVNFRCPSKIISARSATGADALRRLVRLLHCQGCHVSEMSATSRLPRQAP